MDRTRSEPMIRDLLFGTTAAALAAFGYTVLGPMDVEAWQAILLLGLGGAIVALQVWIVVEGLLVWRKAKGVLEEALPPLPSTAAAVDGRVARP